MADEIYVNENDVGTMSRDFKQIGDTLRQVNKALGECVDTLNNTAYTGRVGGTAVKRFIEDLQPVIVELGEKAYEISDDVAESLQAYIRGDELGRTRFY